MAKLEKAVNPSTKGMDDYELKSKAQTLMDAAEIQADAELMKKLKPYLDKKSKAIKSLDDLRKRASEVEEVEECEE